MQGMQKATTTKADSLILGSWLCKINQKVTTVRLIVSAADKPADVVLV
jgi:hypothetical protein